MTNPLAEAALRAGLIPPSTLMEFKRWNPGLEIPEDIPEEPASLEEAAATVRNVLEGQGLVLTKETDLSVLQRYLKTQQLGELHVESDLDTKADFPVVYGTTATGEYILPYRGEDIRELLLNGSSYLRILAEDDHSFDKLVYFKEVREVFFGDMKTFLICTLSLMDVVTPPALTEGSDG